jgi:hypothetical protein
VGHRLGEAADTAHHHGATALARKAETELRATGAKPRRARLAGLEALTASELGVKARNGLPAALATPPHQPTSNPRGWQAGKIRGLRQNRMTLRRRNDGLLPFCGDYCR